MRVWRRFQILTIITIFYLIIFIRTSVINYIIHCIIACVIHNIVVRSVISILLLLIIILMLILILMLMLILFLLMKHFDFILEIFILKSVILLLLLLVFEGTVSVTGDVNVYDMFVEIQFSGTFFEFFKTFVFGKFQAFLFFAL